LVFMDIFNRFQWDIVHKAAFEDCRNYNCKGSTAMQYVRELN